MAALPLDPPLARSTLAARDKEGADRDSPGLVALRRALFMSFAVRLARRMPRHNAYRTASESAVLCPSCSPTMVDGDEGLGSKWVV